MPPLASTFVMAMKSITPQMQQRLDERKAKGNLRALPGIHLPHDFTSNDYLGLARSTELGQMIARRLGELGAPAHGGTGSRLLSGNSDFAMELEQKLARIFKGEAALVFNSGYQANLCLISAVAQKGDTILYDQLSHVCLKEGAWLSKAKTFAFLHNDLADLERRLKTVEGNTFVVIESVYSMDGDVAPLKEIATLCKKYEARLIIDEAHGTGVFGEGGSGLACSLGLEEAFFARVYTFGKAMGVHGAAVVGSQVLIDYLVNFGRPFIYTTAMPLHSLVAIEQAFDYLSQNEHLQALLERRIVSFVRQFPVSTKLTRLPSDTAIQPIVVPGNEKAKAMAKALQNNGIDVRPILAPTVKEGEERLRICLHTYNTEEEINALCQTLSQPF
ncbi:MAG: 8-amino-7-oxononanoate synthase [Imperialibacter sp.]|uniref:aminotransferase class I/II-fold pyridoxal phosphate-dependent enzyme n=1 Tax=Imperialibacter sp. TaxID=2038411 RepID=UPI0032EAF728